MTKLPLANHRDPGDAVLADASGAINAGVFFSQASRLAHAMPDGTHVINLCTTRHGFMLGFAAALMREKVSLLPPGRAPADLSALSRRYPLALVLSEKSVHGLPTFAISMFVEDHSEAAFSTPAIDADATAAILFTSGSTGEPAPCAKSWGQLCRGAELLAGALGWKQHEARAIVGSVPPQHMFGLEATVMLPLQQGIPVHAREPLLAADLQAALRECKRPAWWMTTPMHLRAPLLAPAALPGLQGVVASTMSLPAELASAAESAWKVPVIEVYGSTETGALATRRTAATISWTPLPGVKLHPHGAGEALRLRAEGPHIDPPVILGDAVELQPDGTFIWLGRASDMVKIGGNRTSLSALNAALTGIPGVEDGVFAFPPDAPNATTKPDTVRRLSAFYVSETLDVQQVLAALRNSIGAAFLPRPLHRVERLPRNANGKLTQAALAELFSTHESAQSIDSNHPALAGHFPNDPLVPGVTLLARVAEALRARYPQFVPGELLHARFHSPLRPGEPFAIEARLEQQSARFEVRRAVSGGSDDAPIASGAWTLTELQAGEPAP